MERIAYAAQCLALQVESARALRAALMRFATSTLQTYLWYIALFLDYSATASMAVDTLTLAQVTDYLFSRAASASEDRSANKVGPNHPTTRPAGRPGPSDAASSSSVDLSCV